MMLKRWIVAGLCLLIATPAWAVSIKGVAMPDSIRADGQTLVLNGAGIRTQFLFDVYVGALYLPAKTRDAQQIMSSRLPKRISMHFLLGGIGHAMLAAGWTSAFENELPASAMQRLKARLEKFNAMFGDVNEGDQFTFDFLSDGATVVALNHDPIGRIEGTDFQQALLGIWLGQKPDDPDLKQAMLNGTA
jgi:Chalcone isomerase-like